MKKVLLILGIVAFGINLAGNVILGAKLSKITGQQETTFVVTYNKYDRSTHMPGALLVDVENTFKEKSLKYVSEYVFRTIDIIYKEGENSYKESAEQITYYNTNIENVKNIVAEVQQVYSWMNISY